MLLSKELIRELEILKSPKNLIYMNDSYCYIEEKELASLFLERVSYHSEQSTKYVKQTKPKYLLYKEIITQGYFSIDCNHNFSSDEYLLRLLHGSKPYDIVKMHFKKFSIKKIKTSNL